jgi:hypothetical protein
MTEEMRDDVVRSFYRMRQALGVLGLVLPVALILGGIAALGGVEPSISDYYNTLMRDVFVGTLSAIGVFLICYRGHGLSGRERLSDDTVSTLAGVAALGVAFLPNAPPLAEGALAAACARDPGLACSSVAQQVLGFRAASIGHYASAIVFLGGLAHLSLVRFARSASRARRRIYLASGAIIVAMTAATIVASWFKVIGPAGPQEFVTRYRVVLWTEAVAVWAFALAWLTKGRADQALFGLLRRRRPDRGGG